MFDFHQGKQEQKGAGVGKHQPGSQSSYLPPQPSPAQKLSLDKYREKHAGALTESSDVRGDTSSSATGAPSSTSQVDHRRHSQLPPPQSAGSTTASPVKARPPPAAASAPDRRHHGDKRDKGSLKQRPAAALSAGNSQPDKSAIPSSKDEFKMKIKLSSSDRHSSSDEGVAANNKSKHSSPMVSREKQHRGADLHRHHKHSHSHPNAHSGNGRGGPEGPGGGLLRGPPGVGGMEGAALAPPGPPCVPSSRKRPHPDASHNHHHPSSSSSTSCSKLNKLSKGGTGAAGTSAFTSTFSPSRTSSVLQCVSSGLQLFG